jgi:hypothetical protein
VARIVTSPAAAVVIAAQSGATFRIAPRLQKNVAVFELLDAAGDITQVRVSPDDMRRIAAALMKIAAVLETTNASDETTQP